MADATIGLVGAMIPREILAGSRRARLIKFVSMKTRPRPARLAAPTTIDGDNDCLAAEPPRFGNRHEGRHGRKQSLLSCGSPIESKDGINQPIERHMGSVGHEQAATSLAGPGPKQRYRRDHCLKRKRILGVGRPEGDSQRMAAGKKPSAAVSAARMKPRNTYSS